MVLGDLPAAAREAMASMSSAEQPVWFVLLTFAVAPAFCEEVAFRGFMLSGMARHGRLALAVGLSSVAFGVMHMVPQQVFNASLMGLVLGTLAIRSNSLLPCVMFHFINNTLGVLHGRYGADLYEKVLPTTFFALDDGTLHYRWPTLTVCLGLAVPLLMWVFRFQRSQATDPSRYPEERHGALPLLNLPGANDALVPHRK